MREDASCGTIEYGFAARIRAVRGKMSREDFSETIGVHVNTIGRYERGENEPDISIAAKICRKFNVNPSWLILGEGSIQYTAHELQEVPGALALWSLHENNLVITIPLPQKI